MANIAGNCPDNDQFIQNVNDATRFLLKRGDSLETVVPAYFCVYAGCIVLPRYVESIRALKSCDRTIPVHNQWYQFLPDSQCRSWKLWPGQPMNMEQEGITSTFSPIKGDGRLVRFYARCQADYGKVVQIFGTDNNGQTLMTDNGDGTFREGIPMVLATPFVSTAVYVRHIDYVLKDQTECPVDGYAYNAALNVLENLAHYDPSETTPQYSRIKLSMPAPNNCCNGLSGVMALVKLRFIPVQNDYDLVLVPNEDALEMMVQAIKARRAGDLTSYRTLTGMAIEDLNRALETNSPDSTFSVENEPLGPNVHSNRCF